MRTWNSRAELFRWWRSDVLGLSQKQLAERFGVGRTTVTNWERGTRLTPLDLRRFDEVLSGLLWALEAPAGLEPHRVWTNVYPGASGPVWMWIRSPAQRLKVTAEWGMYAVEMDGPLPPNGRFVTLGASVEDAALMAVLSSPGWIEFGRGVLPDEIPGAEVIDAFDILRPGSASSSPFHDILSSGLAARFVSDDGTDKLGQAFEPVVTFLDDLGRGDQDPSPTPIPSSGIEKIDRSRFIALREARRLSLGELAGRLEDHAGVAVGKDTLRRFELGTGDPHDPLLPAALDQVLGANGYLAVVKLRSGNGPGTVKFPNFWNAPVWLQFDRPTDHDHGVVAELEWDGWHRQLLADCPAIDSNQSPVSSPSVAVAIHGAPRSIRIQAGTSWAAGVGRLAGAVPIDHGWLPTSLDGTQRAISNYEQALIDAVQRRWNGSDRLR